jgi:hypothetical protein
MSDEVGWGLVLDVDCGLTLGWMHMCSLDPSTALFPECIS